MSTPQLRIEFSPSNGTTEVAVFDALPTWADLAARTQILFDIPETDAALAYVDADGDEITLSSEAELREFFSALPGNTDTTTVFFAVRDLRELRASEDSDRTMSTPPASPRGERPGDETADAQFRGPEVFLMRGMFAAHGRGGARSGRGAGRGGFGGRHLHGPHFGHIHHHHHGPPGMFAPHVPPFVGPPRRGEPFDNTNQGVPYATMSREIPRAHSAPPEVHANHPAPQDRIEFTNLPSTCASLHGGCDRGRRSGHHRHREYPYSPFFGHGRGRGSAFDMRGGRGRGCASRGRGGFGGPAHFGSFPHEFFPGMPEPPFGSGGRGRGGSAAHGRGMSFEGPRAVVMGVGF